MDARRLLSNLPPQRHLSPSSAPGQEAPTPTWSAPILRACVPVSVAYVLSITLSCHYGPFSSSQSSLLSFLSDKLWAHTHRYKSYTSIPPTPAIVEATRSYLDKINFITVRQEEEPTVGITKRIEKRSSPCQTSSVSRQFPAPPSLAAHSILGGSAVYWRALQSLRTT